MEARASFPPLLMRDKEVGAGRPRSISHQGFKFGADLFDLRFR
jgi:hypothetical protein